jgi:tetratricopeptide (TPR) repeat protein
MQQRLPVTRWFCLSRLLALVGVLAGVLMPAIAYAQAPPRDGPHSAPSESAEPRDLPQPHSKLSETPRDKVRGLDFLFGALKVAPDEDSAKHVEAQILALWSRTSSDTIALLMQRAKVATESRQLDVAIKLLDAVLKLHPDYIEGWNRRATLYYMQNDYQRSLEDIEQVLIREPRHFGALAGLGMIMQELGDDRRALDAFRKALAIDPHLARVQELVRTLTEKVEGRDI